jgi:hypothetical protein
MKKLWQVPAVESLEMERTANDRNPGKGGDGHFWIAGNDGVNGEFFPEAFDEYGPASAS